MKSYNEFIRITKLMENPEYDSTRFERLLTSVGGNFDGVDISNSKLSSIVMFYEGTNEFNQTKISTLINNSIGNIDRVNNIVIEYYKIK